MQTIDQHVSQIVNDPFDPQAEVHQPKPMLLAVAQPEAIDDDFAVGSYTLHGGVYVFADSTDIQRLHDYRTRQRCFDHRTAVGLPTAGIELPIGPYPLDGKEAKNVPTLLKTDKTVYRIAYKLSTSV